MTPSGDLGALVLDLHCHILEGLDDGPATIEESLAMAEVAAGQGVTTVAATPHLRRDHPRSTPTRIHAACEELAARVPRELGITLVPGGEVDLWWAAEASEDDLRMATYGGAGTDLLIETPYASLGGEFEERLFRLRVQGFRLLLAHPELNPTFQQAPERLNSIVEQGVLLQVTARSLSRGLRSRSGRLARRLISEGVAHVLASDAHGPDRFRPPLLRDGRDAARALVGPRADWMVTDAPEAILAGEPLPPAPQRAAKPRRFGFGPG